MKEFQNNAYFWQKIDTLCLSGDYVETRKAGESHPKYPNLVYPCSYGYYPSADKDRPGFHCFKGSEGDEVVAVVISADILQKDVEAKLLMGVTEQETDDILDFLNQTDFQKTVIVYRGRNIPGWAYSE